MPREPIVVQTEPADVLAIDGHGRPGGPAFQEAVAALYSVAYALKMADRAHTLNLGPLEAQWRIMDGGRALPKDEWDWRLLLRLDRPVEAARLAAAKRACAARGRTRAAAVRPRRINEGVCAEALHVGPYDKAAGTLAAMRDAAREAGFSPKGPHHEIYLNDPRRVAPEKIKTVLVQPLRRA